jgi:hypothetical protein
VLLVHLYRSKSHRYASNYMPIVSDNDTDDRGTLRRNANETPRVQIRQ